VAKILFHDRDSYLQAQIQTNARKLPNVFATRAELQAIADDLLAARQPQRGICHGSRNGWEVEQLRILLRCEVIGTDIAPTAIKFGLIRHDFHVLRSDWRDRFCFAYSNSLDHAHAPQIAVRNWVLSLRPGGRLYVAHSRNSLHAQNLADCYGATLAEYEQLIAGACSHVKTIHLGNQQNADGGTVKDLAIVVGERPRES